MPSPLTPNRLSVDTTSGTQPPDPDSSRSSDVSISPTSGMLNPIRTQDQPETSNVKNPLPAFKVLPSDAVICHISHYLPLTDLANFHAASEVSNKALSESPRLYSVRISRAIPEVKTLVMFGAVREMIPKGRKDLQAEHLLALGDRIHRLPEANQSAALEDFTSAAADFQQELQSIQVLLQAATVTSLEGFRFLLSDTIPSVRADLQPKLLLTLGYRIHGLPGNQTAAADAFISAAPRFDRQHFTKIQEAALNGLLRAAAPRGPFEPSLSLGKYIAETIALSEVCGGESISVVAERYGLAKRYLEGHVIDGRAAAEVRNGESAEVVAKRYGIETPEGIGRLQAEACLGPAIQEALLAECPLTQIAQAHGITTPEGLASLELNAYYCADAKVCAGRPVDALLKAYGTEDPDEVTRLERLAVDVRWGNELLERQRQLVNIVVSKYRVPAERDSLLKKIADEAHARQQGNAPSIPKNHLEWLKMNLLGDAEMPAILGGLAGRKAYEGTPAEKVADEFGITMPSSKARLSKLEAWGHNERANASKRTS